MSAAPLLPEVGVLGIVPQRFSAQWMVPHRVLTGLGRYFEVAYLNPAFEWRDMLARRRRVGPAQPEGAPGFRVHEPPAWLPRVYRPAWLARATDRGRVRHAFRALRARGCAKVVGHVWRPELAGALEAAPFDLTAYHIDDEFSFSSVEMPIDPSEERLLRAVDQVFITSPGLIEKKGGLNPDTLLVPNGVDFEACARPAPEPPELAAIPRPRIGYAGWLKRQLDWALLCALVRAHPRFSFVLVGGRSPHPEIEAPLRDLESRPNVHLLGARSTRELASYPQHFDVCIMPYVADRYTHYIYPLKVHEYLAAGRPTVGTRIRSLEDLAGVVDLASTPGEWSGALERALAPGASAPERAAARREVARRHDWGVLVRTVAGTLARRLGPDTHARFARACADAGAGPAAA